jgi:hypothetical protein
VRKSSLERVRSPDATRRGRNKHQQLRELYPAHEGHGDCEGRRVHRRLRDAIGTLVVLLALLGTVMTISPVLRERVAQVTGASSNHWRVPAQIASKVMVSTGTTALRYAGANTYLVGFLVVAGLLFLLMLRT